MAEDQTPPEQNDKGATRREFLNRFNPFKKTPNEMPTEDEAKKGAEDLIARLGGIKVNRRTVVKGAVLIAGAYTADAALGHLPSRYISRFLTDGDFQNKVLEEIQSGEIVETAQQVVESRTEGPRNFEIGEQVDLKENWMEQCFASSTCYKITGEDVPTYQDRYFVALELDRAMPVENHIDTFDGKPIVNFTKTVQRIGTPLVTLPSNQQEPLEDSNLFSYAREPLLYSAYMFADGRVVESMDKMGESSGGRSQNRGAVIVDRDGKVKVCNFDEATNYRVGENCIAIESCSFTIDSTTLEDDLAVIQQADSLSGMSLASTRRHNSCLVTYYDNQNRPRTYAISRYQHMDFENGQLTGSQSNDTLLSIQELAKLSEDIMRNKGYQRFVMQMPDPSTESQLRTSDYYSEEQLGELGENQHLYAAGKGPDLDRLPLQTAQTIGLERHRILGDGKPIEAPIPKKWCIVAVAG